MNSLMFRIFTTLILLAFSLSEIQGDVVIHNNWQQNGQNWFEAAVSITADQNYSTGWMMKLSFDEPLDELILWVANVVNESADGKEFIIKDKYGTTHAAGATYTFVIQGWTTGSIPTSGTVRWCTADGIGATVGTESTTAAGTTASTESTITAGTTASTESTTTAGTTASTESTTTAGTTISTGTTTTPGTIQGYENYTEALRLSLLFYEAQRSGDLPDDNQVPWRKDSALTDGNDVGLDLSGGWYDAGDHVKFGFPMAGSTTMLLYGLVFFKDGYQSAGQYDMALRQVRWPLDYFIKCHPNSDVFYGQVGDGNADHSYWGRPEDMTMSRPSFAIGVSEGGEGADLAGETAAALAAGSVVFKDTDPAYSTQLLNTAKSLYALGKKLPGQYQSVISNAGSFYSSSHWRDEMAHAAAWLAYATSDNQYLNEAASYLPDGDIWALDWDDKRALVNLLLYNRTQSTVYSDAMNEFVNDWSPNGEIPYTPQGLAFRLQWAPLRYSANAAFLSLLAAKHGILKDKSIAFASSQIHYMLGNNSEGFSYQIDYGSDYPLRPHHRAASCPVTGPCGWDNLRTSDPNPNVLSGALVGGPDINDYFPDNRENHQTNEVACDYNAGFTGALAGLIELSGF